MLELQTADREKKLLNRKAICSTLNMVLDKNSFISVLELWESLNSLARPKSDSLSGTLVKRTSRSYSLVHVMNRSRFIT